MGSGSEDVVRILLEARGNPEDSDAQAGEDFDRESTSWKADRLSQEQKEAIVGAVPSAAGSGSLAVMTLLPEHLTPLPTRLLLGQKTREAIGSGVLNAVAKTESATEMIELLIDTAFYPNR